MKKCYLLCLILGITGCTPVIHRIQPTVNNFIANQRYDSALRSLGNNPRIYGSKNELLYWLDKGLVLHLAGRYRESIGAFEIAKTKFDSLYTHSLTEMSASWLANDYWESYRGDDQEYVLVNVFQALNFAAIGQIHESLVEARVIDTKLKLINQKYGQGKKNVYRDDAFARLLMGILYQADDSIGSSEDARISFDQALHVYNNDYNQYYGIQAPSLLYHLKEGRKESKATVYLIQYTGFMPYKVPSELLIPGGGALVTKLAFPTYIDRPGSFGRSFFIAQGANLGFNNPTELVQGVGEISKSILENRRFLLSTKAILRPGLKLGGEIVAREYARRKQGDLAALGVDLLGSIYNLYSEQADLREWETLPNEIRIARLVLDPGEYQFYVQNVDVSGAQIENKYLGNRILKAGDVKFLIVRSYN